MLFTLERDRLFRPAWQLIGHESDIPRNGDFLTADLAGERVVVIRDDKGAVRAFRNSCRKRPHALVTPRRGRLSSVIQCDIHGLSYGFDGRLRAGTTPGDLTELKIGQSGRFLLTRASGAAHIELPQGDFDSADLAPAGSEEIAVACDWKLLVEQWLDTPGSPKSPRRIFLPPNQLVEVRPAGVLILQVIPESSGRCRIRRLDYRLVRAKSRRSRAPTIASDRFPAWLQQDIEVAESTQRGLAAGASEPEDAGPVSAQLTEFRRTVAALLPGLEASRRGG
jgi:phenylpropionate dioxygenase-like ring-hydroxylating dioxygenase large terminal subunit